MCVFVQVFPVSGRIHFGAGDELPEGVWLPYSTSVLVRTFILGIKERSWHIILSAALILSAVISPTSDGAGAAVLASEAFVRKHGLENQAVEIVAQEMVTDLASTFEENSCIKMVRSVGLVPWVARQHWIPTWIGGHPWIKPEVVFVQ